MNIIDRMQDDLHSEYGKQDWRLSLRAGPECIGILGQCLLITSRPDMKTIKLSGNNLPYETLFANIRDCAQFGQDTFQETDTKMKQVASLSHELSRRDGIIESMLKFCNPDQDQRRDRHLKRYLKRGRKSVTECVANINEIQQCFYAWQNKTKLLLKALDETDANKCSEAEAIEIEIDRNNVERKLKDETKLAEEKRLEAHNETMEKARHMKEWYESYAAKFANIVGGTRVASGGFVAAALALSEISTGALVGVGGAAAFLHYHYLKKDLLEMEDAQIRREIEILEIAAKTSELQAALKKLSSDKTSIAEVMKIVQASVLHLTQLQNQIGIFMKFLGDISTIILETVDQSEFVYDVAEDTAGLVDTEIKKDLLKGSCNMMMRFAFASRASRVYTTISACYILPTIENLPKLRLMESGSDEEINNRLTELNNLRAEICDGTENLTAKMHAEIKQDFRVIVEESVASIQPMLQATTAARD